MEAARGIVRFVDPQAEREIGLLLPGELDFDSGLSRDVQVGEDRCPVVITLELTAIIEPLRSRRPVFPAYEPIGPQINGVGPLVAIDATEMVSTQAHMPEAARIDDKLRIAHFEQIGVEEIAADHLETELAYRGRGSAGHLIAHRLQGRLRKIEWTCEERGLPADVVAILGASKIAGHLAAVGQIQHEGRLLIAGMAAPSTRTAARAARNRGTIAQAFLVGLMIDLFLGARGGCSAFVNGQKAEIQRDGQQGQRSGRRDKLAGKAAIGQLRRFRAGESRADSTSSRPRRLPGKGPGPGNSAGIPDSRRSGRCSRSVPRDGPARLELRKVLARARANTSVAMELRQRFAEAAQAAGIADLARGGGHADVVGNGPVDRIVGDLDAGIAGGQEPHEHRAADRGVGIGGIRANNARPQ